MILFVLLLIRMPPKTNSEKISPIVTQENVDAIVVEETNLEVEKQFQEIESNIQEIKQSLDALKQETDTFDAQKSILDQVAIDKKIQELENKRNETEKKKTETEALIKNLVELNELKKHIQWYDQNKIKLDNYTKQLHELNSWATFWDKTKKIASEVRSTTGWKVATIGLWAVTLRWLSKSLFGDEEDDEPESDDESSNKKKKKWFFNHGIWKWLKYAGIAIGWVLWIKWLVDYFDKDKNPASATDTPKQQTEARKEYLKENPEEAKKYIQLWENVDGMYYAFSKKERDSWWIDGISLDEWYEKYADKNTKDKDTFKAIVPFSVDQEFGSVEKLLSEGWYYGYVREKSGTDLLNTVLSFVKSHTNSALIWFLGSLASFAPFVWQSAEDWIKKWFEAGDPQERTEELQLFFRQYAKIVTYMQDKNTAFKEIVAKEKFSANPWEFANLEDAMWDDEWFKTNVLNDPRYVSFYQWSFKGATDVLAKEKLFDATASSFLSSTIASCDGVRGDLLNEDVNGVDALWRLHNDINKNTISDESKKEAQETIDNVSDNITKELDATFTYGVASSLHVALNTDDNNVQEFLKESGLLQFKETLKVTLQDYKKKFADGTITVAEAKDYHRLVNSYFAFKKEIIIGAESLQQMKSDNIAPAERTLQVIKAAGWNLFDATARSMKKLGKIDVADPATYYNAIGAWAWWTWAVGAAAGVACVARQPGLAKAFIKIHSAPVYALYKLPTKNAYIRSLYNKLPTGDWLRSFKYRWISWETLFWGDVEHGHLSREQAKDLRKQNGFKKNRKWSTGEFEKIAKNKFTVETIEKLQARTTLATKTTDEIRALKRELQSIGSWPLAAKNTRRITKEIDSFESLAKKIAVLDIDTAVDLVKATEKISIRTLATLTHEMKDPTKLWSLLDDLLKNSTKIDAPEIALKLKNMWEDGLALLFQKENDFNKKIIKELSDLHASKTILSHVDEGVLILAKLLKKIV